VLAAGVAGVGEQDVGVEVAPAQLADPGGGAGAAAAGGARLALGRRQAAPAQVRRQAARAVLDADGVVCLDVAVDRAVQPGRQRGA
jgi:hypothetical protein